MKPIYKVPVIPNNLRHRETFIQIADALNYLNQVFDDILSRVNTRVSDKQKHVAILRGRITKVHEKVQKITKTKKATQVFSNSKYPINKNNETYKSIFGTENNDLDFNSVKTKIKLKEQLTTENSNNILQFYHVKIKKDKQDLSGMRTTSLSGLGRFPPNAQIVNELLLFNTHKNPYKNYEMLDPLNNHSNENMKQNDDTNPQGPDAAPLSMTQRIGAVRESKENYFYSPDLGEVPTIDVPLDLPNLPGVADDLRYLMELGPGIAPSVTTTPVIPDLPLVTPSTISQPISRETSSSTFDTSMDIPPIDLPDLSVLVESPVPITSTPLPIIEPEPIVIEKMEISVTDRPVDKPLPKTDVSADIRANLMEAIRQAGKKNKLHSVKTEEPTPKSQGVNIGNDLMADLHAKLAMRRKGISGTRAADGGLDASSAMTKVSAMIPPPVPSANDLVESTATEDEDNDWDE